MLPPKATGMPPGTETPIVFGSVDEETLRAERAQQKKNKGINPQSDKTGDNHGRNDKTEDRPKITSKTCKLIAIERMRTELPGQKIDERIQYMRDHALIGKFIGFWPTEKALYGWIAAKWKPKGHVTLQLGPKGFFTGIFLCLEDKYRIMDEGPYFFNSAGLYLRD